MISHSKAASFLFQHVFPPRSAHRLSAKYLLLGLAFSLLAPLSAQAAIPAAERQVLLDLYEKTHGAKWKKNTNWLGAEGTECTWHGITCDESNKHVTQVSLNFNCLSGNLPPLSGLSQLKSFDVSRNKLTGTIPSLAELKNLEIFYVYRNQLSGEIPSLSGLPELMFFMPTTTN